MVFVLALSIVTPINGVSAETNMSGEEAQVIKDAQTIEKYLTFNSDGTMSFDSESAEKDGVREGLISQTKADEQKINNSISKNGFDAEISCAGTNTYKYLGSYSGVIAMDDCLTKRIVYYLTVGAAAATVITAITSATNTPVSIASGVVAGLLSYAAATLAYYNKGSGVYLYIDLNNLRDFDLGSQ